MLGLLGKRSNEKPCDTIDTLIGAKAEFKGDIVFAGGLRVDGKVKGNITAKGEGNSMLIVSENAEVVGNVKVPHLIINGKIKGNVHSSQRLELQPQADIIGDVHYKAIEMALEAAINGNLLRAAGAGREKAVGTEKGVTTKLEPLAVPGDGAP